MDIYKFVNSKDVRKYLKDINYEFNTLEAVYLIYFARDITLKDKHSAWKEVIESMPDMAPKDYFDHFQWEYFGNSIHGCLRQHMENERKIIGEFEQVSKGAFFVRTNNKDGEEWDSRYFTISSLFTSVDEVGEYINDCRKEDDDREIYKFEIICKPENSQKQYNIIYSREGQLLAVDISAEFYPEPRLDWQFETMWFAFPTPFKEGDIVIDPERPDPGMLWSGPFVFRQTAAEWFISSGRKGHDYTDMTASGWFQDEDGLVYREVMHDYMALEYYPTEKLEGLQRILIALSNRIKNKIDDELFANAYSYYLAEALSKKLKPQYYTDEGLRLVGLPD